MTEKRFKLKYINEEYISANLFDNGTFIGAISIGEELILELLSDLSNENEQLKKENQELKRKVKTMAKELCNCEEDYILEEYL